MIKDEKEQILRGFLDSVEYRNYCQKNIPSNVGGFTVYDFQLQTLLAVISMIIENKDIPEGLKKVCESIMSCKDSILSINNSIDAINNDDVVNAINDISFADIIASVEELYDRTGNLEKGQQATIQTLSNIVDKMNMQQNINVKAFNDICYKLDKIVENTSTNEPEPKPQPEPKQTKGYETLIVKSTENGISSVGGWYIKPYTRQLETTYGELKLEGSKKVIPVKDATVITTIKYTDGNTNKLKIWNGGFEYVSTPKTNKSVQTKTTTKVQKGSTNSTILNKSKESNGTIMNKSNTAPIVWDLRKLHSKQVSEEKNKTYETKRTVYINDFHNTNRIAIKREWDHKIANDWRQRFYGDKKPKLPGT